MARVLVLRQAPEAAETAEALRARGHEPVLLPLAETVALDAPAPQGEVAGFVVTSLQAVPALASAFPGDPRPVFAVGERTAQALSAAGFPSVEAGPGTSEGLVGRAGAIAAAAKKPLLYATGRVRLPDFEAGALAAGVALTVWEVYDLVPREPEAAEIDAVFQDGGPNEALILSVGQAEGFAGFWRRFGARAPGMPRLLCLSARISRALGPELAPFAWISPQPKLSSLFDRFLPPSLDYGGRK